MGPLLDSALEVWPGRGSLDDGLEGADVLTVEVGELDAELERELRSFFGNDVDPGEEAPPHVAPPMTRQEVPDRTQARQGAQRGQQAGEPLPAAALVVALAEVLRSESGRQAEVLENRVEHGSRVALEILGELHQQLLPWKSLEIEPEHAAVLALRQQRACAVLVHQGAGWGRPVAPLATDGVGEAAPLAVEPDLLTVLREGAIDRVAEDGHEERVGHRLREARCHSPVLQVGRRDGAQQGVVGDVAEVSRRRSVPAVCPHLGGAKEREILVLGQRDARVHAQVLEEARRAALRSTDDHEVEWPHGLEGLSRPVLPGKVDALSTWRKWPSTTGGGARGRTNITWTRRRISARLFLDAMIVPNDTVTTMPQAPRASVAARSRSRPLDFLLVGAPRCGTTSLFEYLRRHPGVFVPAAKELPFFTDETRFSGGWDTFVDSFFAGAPPEALWGKLTPHYWESPETAAPRIAAAMPEVKLLALLRNPVERAHSHYRFLVRRDVEPTSFATAVGDRTGRKYQAYVPPGEYGRVLDVYLRHFEREQIHVMFTEELEADPTETFDRLLLFLGLSQDYRPANLGRRYNVGGAGTRFRGVVGALRRASPVRAAWHRLPERTRRRIGRWFFFEVAPKREAPAAISADVNQRLVEHYRPEVRRLEEILQRKVPWAEFHR